MISDPALIYSRNSAWAAVRIRDEQDNVTVKILKAKLEGTKRVLKDALPFIENITVRKKVEDFIKTL